MEQQILKTKLYMPPLPQKLVYRPRLFGKYTAGHETNITLVVAPAGYGKTTLLCQGLQSSRKNIGWLTLDPDDNDITRFWLYFISAMQTVRPHLGESASKQLRSRKVSIKSVITDIINEISEIDKKFVLILDDFHVIKSSEILSTLEYFVNNMPPQIHLIITSRSYPQLSLSRLRARRLLKELSVDELRFTTNETVVFFNDVMEFGLNTDEITILESRIEGWIAGMQMLAISMQGRGDIPTFIANFHGSNRYLMDYLIEEVLSKQKATNISFLLETAILDRFTASLCNAVTGREDSQEKLEQLESANIFLIPLDNEHKWYRYHRIFADLLLKQLPLRSQLTHDQQKSVADLHIRASNWFEQEGLIDEAIHHALAAPDFDLAASIISKSAKYYVCSGKVSTFLNLLEKIPEGFIYKWPELSTYYVVAIYTIGKMKLAEKIMSNVREIVQKLSDSVDSDRLLGELDSVLVMIAAQRCDVIKAIKGANEAFTMLPHDSLMPRARANMALAIANEFNGDFKKSVQIYKKVTDLARKGGHNFLVVNSLANLAESSMRQGCLTQAKKHFEEIIELEEQLEIKQFPPAGIGYIGLVRISLERNDIESASQYIDKGIELCEILDMSYYLIPTYYAAARLKLALGDRSGAINELNKLNQLNRKEYSFFVESPAITFRMGEYQTRIRLLLGDLEMALYWARSCPDCISDKIFAMRVPPILYETQQVLLARVYSAMGNYDQAIDICDQINNSFTVKGHIGKIIQIGLVEAVAMRSKGDVQRALSKLERTLSLTEPEGYIRIFIDAGEPMKMLLLEAESHGIRPKYVNRLVSAFINTTHKKLHSPIPLEKPSEREIEILKLMESGMTNHMIAEKLLISKSTAKTHISNIYLKLGVQNRAQAIYRARELNLV